MAWTTAAVKWSLAAERADTPVDARIVMEAASEYLADTLASGQASDS